jgi:GNAT superfamily N-acetyltransferase
VATVADVTIRTATTDDARSIAEVHVSSWRWAYDRLLPATVLDALSVDARAGEWASILAGSPGHVSVAVGPDGLLRGFASVGATRDGDGGAGTGELFAIYVEPGSAGRGVGSALQSWAEQALRDGGFTRATLWVLETNERARRFYERRGWTFDGTRGEHRFDCGNRPIVRYAREL